MESTKKSKYEYVKEFYENILPKQFYIISLALGITGLGLLLESFCSGREVSQVMGSVLASVAAVLTAMGAQKTFN